jgi:hypothetical protein
MSVQGKVVISNESESNLLQFDHRDSPKIRHPPIIRFQRDIARVFRGDDMELPDTGVWISL